MYYNDYLAHYGVLGMKWGVRRYQNPDGSLTNAGKKRYSYDGDGNVVKLTRKQRRQNEREEKTRTAAEAHEAAKQKALESGTAKDVLKYKGELSAEQIQKAVNRIDWETRLSDIASKQEASERNKGWDMVDSVMNKVGKATDWANKAANAYNAGERIAKIITGRKETQESKRIDALIKTNDISRILKRADEMSSAQLKDAVSRVNNLEKLRTMLSTDKPAKNVDTTDVDRDTVREIVDEALEERKPK